MLKQTPKKRVLFVRRVTPVALALFGVFSLAFANLHQTPAANAAAYNSTVNFQARLQTAAGAVVADDNYNVQFKLYDVSTGGTALWTETYLNNEGHGLTTVNGYLSTGLGSRVAFPSDINWSHQLWVTMNIGGTGSSASWDGEMTPRMELTAIPYAFQANQLIRGNDDGTLSSILNIQAPSGGNQNFVIQDQGAAGTFNLLTGNQADDLYLHIQDGNTDPQDSNLYLTGTGSFFNGVLTHGNFTSSDGSLELNGEGVSDYVTPLGVTVHTKINIANFDPGAYGQIIALGLPSSAASTSRVITVLDARTSAHQPSITVLSPNEDQVFGLSWDGSNSVPVLKSSTSDLALQVGGVNAVTVYNGSGNSILNVGTGTNGTLQLSNSTNGANVSVQGTGVTSNYVINLPSGLGTAGQCLSVASVASSTEAIGYRNCASTLQDAYTNSGASPVIALNGTGNGIKIQDASTPVTGNLLAIQNATATTNYFAVSTSGASVTGGLNVSGTVDATTVLADSLGIGTGSPTRPVDIAVNNSTVDAPSILIDQAGSGDATIEFKNGTSSFYVGQDHSNSNTFTINSSGAAAASSSIAYVQSSQSSSGSGSSTITSTLGSSVTAGHLIVVGFAWTHAAGDGTVTCSDTLGSTFTNYGFNPSGTSEYFKTCYAIASGSGSDTITVNFGTSVSFRRIVVSEYSGVDTTNPLDDAAMVNDGSGTDPQTGSGTDNATTQSATTTSNGDMIVGIIENTQGFTYAQSAGTGFTQRTIANTNELILEDRKQATAGSVAATTTIANSGVYYEGAVLAFRAASSGVVSDTFDNSLFTLSQGGAANFQNTTDGANAFRVQDASGANMFNIDTSNQKVTIGPAGGDTTGTLLVLGNKTTSGDPTEVDGAMYYNSSSNSFRCGEGGIWVSCVGGLLTASTAIASTVSNTTTETAFSKTFDLPANYCANGRVLRLTANGLYSALTNSNFTIKVKLGSTVVATSENVDNFGSHSGDSWGMNLNLMCPNAAGGTSPVTSQGVMNLFADNDYTFPYTSTNVATNAAKTLSMTLTWSGASASNSVTLESFMLEGLGQ